MSILTDRRKDNLNRLIKQYGWIPADIARKTGRHPQQVNTWTKKGFGEKAAKLISDRMGIDAEEFNKDYNAVGKMKGADELLFELISQLSTEDKKTVARIVARLLNTPKVALIITKEIHSLIDRT